MPELPEVQAIADYLDGRIAGLPIHRVDVASMSVLKTADPSYQALHGGTVDGVRRVGKYLVIDVAASLHLVIHLSRAGWLRWSDALPTTPPRPGGKSPIALRVHAGLPGEGFDLTEAGTQKRLAAWIVRALDDVPRLAHLGPDVLAVDQDRFTEIITAQSGRVKTVLTDQRILAGVGNAYSDEILHAARLSPFALCNKLTAQQVSDLFRATQQVLGDAIDRSAGLQVARLKGEKRSGMSVHARAGLPCPVCGETVREVSYTDRSFQYCPGCQTGGKILADRRMSRLLK